MWLRSPPGLGPQDRAGAALPWTFLSLLARACVLVASQPGLPCPGALSEFPAPEVGSAIGIDLRVLSRGQQGSSFTGGETEA